VSRVAARRREISPQPAQHSILLPLVLNASGEPSLIVLEKASSQVFSYFLVPLFS